MVDDASGDTLARMGSEETIWAAAGVLRAWVKKYGVPVALYTDWKNVYVREASRKEQSQGVVPVTQFGQMCQRLGIGIIAANSPQAKGRVERNHGTHQDRLVKKMRLKKIQTHAEANGFLEKEYLPEHNRRFRRTPAQPEDYHRAAPRGAELEEVFHLETGRVIGNDWVVRHDNRYFQVKAQARQCAGQGQSHGVRMGRRAITEGAVEGALAPFACLIDDLFGPSAREAGLAIQDTVRFFRLKRSVRLFQRTTVSTLVSLDCHRTERYI